MRIQLKRICKSQIRHIFQILVILGCSGIILYCAQDSLLALEERREIERWSATTQEQSIFPGKSQANNPVKDIFVLNRGEGQTDFDWNGLEADGDNPNMHLGCSLHEGIPYDVPLIADSVLVGYPPFFYPFDGYPEFLKNSSREPMIYRADNDGLLHAIDYVSRVEEWLFVSTQMKSQLMNSTKMSLFHKSYRESFPRYYETNSPKAGDVFAEFCSGQKEWRTILVVNGRPGLPGYAGLDITNGRIDEKHNPIKVLWELSDKELGETRNEVSINRVRVAGSQEKTDWGVFFSTYYTNNNPTNRNSYLYGISANKAEDFWKDRNGKPTNRVKVGNCANDSLADPLLVDMEGDYVADRMYLGNLYGDMFRVENIGKFMSPKVSKLFSYENGGPNINPIRVKADYAHGRNIGDIWIFFGSGKLETFHEKQDYRPQYFFGIKDHSRNKETFRLDDLVTLTPTFFKTVANGEYDTVRVVEGENPFGKAWKMRLSKVTLSGRNTSWGDECLIAKPIVLGGIVFFATFMPDKNDIHGNGVSWIMAVEYDSGMAASEPVFDINNDGQFDEKDTVKIDGKRAIPMGVKAGSGIGSNLEVEKDRLYLTITENKKINPVNGKQKVDLLVKNINLAEMKIRLEAWRQK